MGYDITSKPLATIAWDSFASFMDFGTALISTMDDRQVYIKGIDAS